MKGDLKDHQLELFDEEFSVKPELKNIDRFDVTEINLFLGGEGRVAFESSNRLINRTKNLPSNTYFIYKQGLPCFPELPFVKNEKTGTIYSISDTRHSYPTLAIKSIPWDMHKLVGHAFIKNDNPSKKYQIDHINNKNHDFCKKIINTFQWARAALHMVDFRPSNLRWCSNAQNQRYKY
jgi:hypothetical protein